MPSKKLHKNLSAKQSLGDLALYPANKRKDKPANNPADASGNFYSGPDSNDHFAHNSAQNFGTMCKKHWKYSARFFFWGAFGAILLVVFQQYLIRLQNLLFALLSGGLLFTLQAFDLDQFLYIGSGLWQAYFSSALMEELLKWFILQRLLLAWLSSSASLAWGTAAQNRLFSCHCAALCALWGLLLGLGFSATENLFYVLRFGYSSLYLRLGTAVLVHLGLGAFVAVRLYGYSLLSGCKSSRIAKPSKLSKRSKCLKFYAPIRSLLWAIFLHGTYNAALHFGSLLLALAIVLLIVFLAFFSYRRVCGLAKAAA